MMLSLVQIWKMEVFWIECPSLPGSTSQGDTIEEALEMIKDAMIGYLEVVAEKRRKKKGA